MSEQIDTTAVLAASSFNIGDVVDVTHPIYSGRAKIVEPPMWLENIKRREGEPSHFLVWMCLPLADDFPGIVDIIDPMYGVHDRGRSMRAAPSDAA
jgi:hypothetical protein